MTKLLQTVIEKLDQLPDDVQDRYLVQLLADLTRENAVQAEEKPDNELDGGQKHEKVEIRAGRGGAKGLILYMADDFDAPLEDFKDYM